MVKDNNKIYFTMRFAAAMCFIGHGAFGIITKPIWCNYFGVVGIDTVTSYKLMPIVGTMDIVMGISLLFYPTKAAAWWLVIWGFATAMMRPLSGEPFAELIERAGNFGVPLALLLFCGDGALRPGYWLGKLTPPKQMDAETLIKVKKCLMIVVFLLLAGHGWLNVIEKKGLLGQYARIGFSNPAQIAHITGIFEIAAALMVLIRPLAPVLLILLFWKMGTELFYPQWELFEWVERGGSYGAILALWFILPPSAVFKSKQNFEKMFA